MSFNRYYQDELLALRELGREFAQRNPALAPFMDTPGRDPDVERILEGFSFLTGRLRQKLDDELPEITHSLFSLLWPNYLRPIPAASVIRYLPGENISGAVSIARGTEVESVEVDGLRCRFRTVYETEILPLRIVEQSIRERDGRASIVLRIAAQGVSLENIPLRQLRFFISGEPAIAHTIYFSMAARTREVRVALRDEHLEEHVTAVLPADEVIRPVGFREDEGLYPYPANTFPGYRILQEYFCFPDKFLFVEVAGLEQGLSGDALKAVTGAREFELHFVMDNLPEHYESFRADNWHLFCTPVVNLFGMDASPLTLDQRQTEYRIVPDPRQPYHYAVYSVDDVGTWGHDDRSSRRYLPFESFEHDVDAAQAHAYYRLRLRPSHHDGCTETYISIVQTADSAAIPQSETISLELTCTNRQLPHALRMGDIRVHADNTPDSVAFANITPVVPSFNPPLEGDILWRLLSNMSLNYMSLTDVAALRAVLAAYDFRAPHDRPRARMLEKTLKGMLDIRCSEANRIYGGLPVRGAQTRLTLDQRAFCAEGAMYLFGAVLNEFFALYATVNSFHQLTIVEAARGEEYRWPARLGRISL
ncbi:type VI secretion system baseplate subunit TssF [Desulfovibrio porci]|uniref:type VI secretion system baseplate subunit TssF n=1 Tax=Desulfovibrio porci TaxID=2605782 RepID=UPI000ABD759E